MTIDSSVGEKPTPPYFLDAQSVADRYQVSTTHWRRLVDAGKAPQPRRFGRLVRWAAADLDAWDADGNPPIRQAKLTKGGQR